MVGILEDWNRPIGACVKWEQSLNIAAACLDATPSRANLRSQYCAKSQSQGQAGEQAAYLRYVSTCLSQKDTTYVSTYSLLFPLSWVGCMVT